MAMKVYGGCYDGKNRVIVAALTKQSAFDAMSAFISSSFYSWKQYTTATGNQREIAVAMSAPGTVFSALNDYRSEFRALGATPSNVPEV